MSIPGIDLSNWQTAGVNFDAVAAAGYQFACIKATEGTTFPDPDFARNWSECRRVGMVPIAYHFARPSLNTPSAEVAYFLAHVGTLEPGEGMALDMEDTDAAGDLSAWTLAFLSLLTAAIGFNPFFYSGEWFMGPHNIIGNAAFAPYGLWLAAYQAALPASPAPWSFIATWQNSDTTQVPGVPGNCDTDIFEGSRDQLLLYCKQQPVTPPAPVPSPLPVMTNDDAVYIIKQLIPSDGPLNPAAGIAALSKFVVAAAVTRPAWRLCGGRCGTETDGMNGHCPSCHSEHRFLWPAGAMACPARWCFLSPRYTPPQEPPYPVPSVAVLKRPTLDDRARG